LSNAGLIPAEADPTSAPLTFAHARRMFEHAVQSARRRGDDSLAALAAAYLERLDQEADSASVLSHLDVAAGWTRTEGLAAAGEGFFLGEDWTGAQPLPDVEAPTAILSGHGYSDRLSWQASAGRLLDDWRVATLGAGVALGPIDVWAGRRRLEYATGRGGGIVTGVAWIAAPDVSLLTLDSFDGATITVRDPFRLPWILHALGPARIEVAAGMLDRNGRIESPWLVLGRFTVSPLDGRVTLGVNRGAIFGGEG